MSQFYEIKVSEVSSQTRSDSIRVSVVVPTYNRPESLQACVTALLRQSYPGRNSEILIIDDGSEPALTANALLSGGKVDSELAEIRIIRQQNAGPAAARNRGIREARGTLIAFTDDDCIPSPDWLSLLVQAYDETPGALLGGLTSNGLNHLLFSEASQLMLDMLYRYYNREQNSAMFLTSNNWLCAREQLLSIGAFDMQFREAAGEDWDLCARWREAGWNMRWVPDAMIEHRHAQRLRNFCRMHFRYGKGAYRFHKQRSVCNKRNSDSTGSFNRHLPRLIPQALQRYPSWSRRLQLLTALVIMQSSVTLGYLTASMSPTGTRQ